MRALLALTAAALVAANKRPLLRIDDIMGSSLPNIFTVPGIDAGPDHGQPSSPMSGSRVRRLEAKADGTFPHVINAGAWDGVSETHGFLSLRYNTLLPNTTVNLEQYTDVWTASSVECTVVGAQPFVDDIDVVHKTQVVIEVTLPGAVLTGMADAVAHMRTRLRAGHSMVIGPHLMRALPSFHGSGSCASTIPATSPYFRIVATGEDATPGGGGGVTIIYALVPLDLHSVFGWSNIEFEWDPIAEREVALRRELGLSLPPDIDAQLDAHLARRRLLEAHQAAAVAGDLHARELAKTFDRTWDLLNFNYDPTTKAAKQAKIDIIPGGVLYAEDTYAFFTVKASCCQPSLGAAASVRSSHDPLSPPTPPLSLPPAGFLQTGGVPQVVRRGGFRLLVRYRRQHQDARLHCQHWVLHDEHRHPQAT